MARRKSRKLKAAATQTYSTSFVLNDNLPRASAAAVDSANTKNYFVREGARDQDWLDSFHRLVAREESTGIVITSDRGKGDRVLPSQIQRYYDLQTGRLVLISCSISGKGNILKAFSSLRGLRGFSGWEEIIKKYKWVKLSRSGKKLRVEFQRINGKKGFKEAEIFQE